MLCDWSNSGSKNEDCADFDEAQDNGLGHEQFFDAMK